MISKILLEKIIACADESNKGECWLCNYGTQMRVMFEVTEDLVYITFKSFSNRVVVNKKAKIKNNK